MTEIIAVSVIIICIVVMCSFVYLNIRNEAVFRFRMIALELAYAKANREIEQQSSFEECLLAYEIIDLMPSYNKMVYSFKPLTLKKYIKKKDLEYLLS